jgi:hypothetical protein
MTWRAVSARPCLAAALADYPVIAGRVRVKTQSGHQQDLEIVLSDAGVRPYVYQWSYQTQISDHVIHNRMSTPRMFS